MAGALVIEDDDGIRTVLAMTLSEAGFEVSEADSAEMGLVELGARDPDLILVDLRLGTLDGLDFIRLARRITSVPIIVVSAVRENPVIVEALEAGADDYVTKPFDVDVLTARCRALIRRGFREQVDSDDLTLDRGRLLVLHIPAGTLTLGSREVHLTKTEFRVLVEFASCAGRVLSRGQLLDRIWDTDSWAGDDRLVDVHVSRLRTKIEADATRPVLLVTVRGQGYRLDLQ